MAIPEFGPAALSDDVRHTYGQTGAIILRGALARASIESARENWLTVVSLFDLKIKELSQGQLNDEYPFKKEVSLFERYHFIQHVVLRLLDKAAGVAPLLEATAVSLFGKPVSFVEGKSAIRRQGASSRPVPWHRDAHAVKTQDDGNCVNFWVPLDEVGSIRPSLQIACGSATEWKDRPVDYSEIENPPDEDVASGYEVATAFLNPGDVLVFGHHTLHRTQPMANSSIRLSGEFRFDAPRQGD